jgi:uncharacterized integral membrane protein
MNDTTPADAPKLPPKSKKPIYTRPKFILSMIAAVIFLILIFQNWASVSVNMFFMTDRQVPAALMYVGFSLVGFIVGWLVKRPKHPAKND